MSDPGTADVQAELQDYLNSKNINTLFIQIVESLLIEKPDNPIGFIVEYLKKKYPDQAGPVGGTAEQPVRRLRCRTRLAANRREPPRGFLSV